MAVSQCQGQSLQIVNWARWACSRVQDGFSVIEDLVTAVWIGADTDPDHAWPPRLAQQLLEPGVQLRQEAQMQSVPHILIALQRCEVQHMAQLAQPHGVVQQALKYGHGDGVATETEGGEMGAVAQRGQESTELGVHDAAFVQVLQCGRGPLNQDLQVFQTEAGQVDPAETQVLQQADAGALWQVRQV